MQGAAAGVIGSGGALGTNWSIPNQRGLTATVGAPTTQKGIDTNTVRLNGTPSSSGQVVIAFEAANQIAAALGQVWTASVFRAFSAGAKTNVAGIALAMMELDSGGGFLETDNGPDVTTIIDPVLTRYSFTNTLSNALTAFVRPMVVMTVTSGQALDITYTIGWPQMELASAASSPIRTVSAARLGVHVSAGR